MLITCIAWEDKSHAVNSILPYGLEMMDPSSLVERSAFETFLLFPSKVFLDGRVVRSYLQ